jgi:DNA invertase Pin-like site-specific DNA recombinase
MIYWNRPHVRPIAKIVAYYRLDETESGKSDAYGLEDQRRDVARFAADRNATLVMEYSEVASGEKDWEQRAELSKAISMAQMHQATLVVGRQDRLACTIYIISGLMDSGLDFVSVDNPNRGPFQKHMRAIFDKHGCIPGTEL